MSLQIIETFLQIKTIKSNIDNTNQKVNGVVYTERENNIVEIVETKTRNRNPVFFGILRFSSKIGRQADRQIIK